MILIKINFKYKKKKKITFVLPLRTILLTIMKLPCVYLYPLYYIFIGYPSWSTSTIGLYICICSRKNIKFLYCKREFDQYNVNVRKKNMYVVQFFSENTKAYRIHKAPLRC
jgi:hypothetical protein